MSRPVTLFTGQWADLAIADLAPRAKSFGYDGLELACWGDHFDVRRALAEPGYVRAHRELLERHDLNCWAISNHLVGQAVCDPIDDRHRSVLPPEVWGDGDPEGVRQTRGGPGQGHGAGGSRVWRHHRQRLHRLGSSGRSSTPSRPTTLRPSPPATPTSPSGGARSSTCSTRRAFVSASRCIPPRSPTTSSPRVAPWRRSTIDRDLASTSIRATSSRSSWIRRRSSRSSAIGSTTSTSRTPAAPSTGGARSSGRISTSASTSVAGISSPQATGTWTSSPSLRVLNRIGYQGPLSVEWEDAGMDREWGAADAARFVREHDFAPSAVVFDEAFSRL